MIKLLVCDIDGVLTDGSILVNSKGEEQKCINVKDLDALYELKREGIMLAAITGEDTPIAAYFCDRIPWDRFVSGCKKKKEMVARVAAELGVELQETAYIGDGKYDLEVLPSVGLSFCPNDSIQEAQSAADIVLQRNGGAGCLWETLEFLKQQRVPESPLHYFDERIEEHQMMFKRLLADRNLAEKAMQVAQRIEQCIRSGGCVYLCGNGGSAADAQHIAAEFIGRFYKERPAYCAEALTVNTSILTAIGNDYGFERIFARQLQAKARPGDMLIGISTSGSSNNVLEALRYGAQNGLTNVMLTGAHYPKEVDFLCKHVVAVPAGVTSRIQEAHIFLGHMWAEYVESRMTDTENRGE